MLPVNPGGHSAHQTHVVTNLRKYYPNPDKNDFSIGKDSFPTVFPSSKFPISILFFFWIIFTFQSSVTTLPALVTQNSERLLICSRMYLGDQPLTSLELIFILDTDFIKPQKFLIAYFYIKQEPCQPIILLILLYRKNRVYHFKTNDTLCRIILGHLPI